MHRNRIALAVGSAVRGFLMGSADVVPGVSGGTVALVTGIYERLVHTISTGSKALESLVRGDLATMRAKLREIEWWFLVPLLVGAAVAVLTLAHFIEELLVDQPLRMAALFFGLILGTIYVAWKLLHSPAPLHAAIAAVVGVIAFVVFGFQSVIASPTLAVYFVAGALAICAFILPGVSGSFLLLSIGMYQPVIGAINDRDLPVIAVFGLGAILSLAIFSRLLDRLLQRHHDTVTAVLIGLMIGSLRILWPWPNGLGDPDGVGATELAMPSGDVVVPIVLIVVGAAVVVAASLWARRTGADRETSARRTG